MGKLGANAWLGLALLAGAGCVDDTGALTAEPLDTPCGDPPEFNCIAQVAGPCSAYQRVPAECRNERWVCPVSGFQHTAAEPATDCRPSILEGAPAAFGPLVPVGRECRMGVSVDVTGDADLQASWALPQFPVFGSCPAFSTGRPSWVSRDSLLGEDIVDANDVVATPEAVFAAHRLFRRAPEAPFGVEGVGASVVRMRGDRMPVPKPPAWSTHGYRSLAWQGEFLYVFDCFGLPDFLIEDCGVMRARLDEVEDPAAYAWLDVTGDFVAAPAERKVVFEAGPQHDVAFHPGLGLWVMVSVAGFGDTVFARTAPQPTGPWSEAVDIARCRLPDGDPAAFCDTARIVLPLGDPLRPQQVALTYRVDTTAEDRESRRRSNPAAYSSVLTWAEL